MFIVFFSYRLVAAEGGEGYLTLEARLERLLRLGCSLVGRESLVELPVDGVTIGLFAVHEAWWPNVQFTIRLALLEVHETVS